MDLSTLKRNLDQKHYTDANGFYEDFQLMINNCVRYNPVGTAVYIAGQDLLKAFSEKWRGVPPLHTPPPSDDEDEESGEFGKFAVLFVCLSACLLLFTTHGIVLNASCLPLSF